MIVLYHCIDARSFRPLWTLEELRMPYDLRVLPFPPRVKDKAYLEVNPLGTIPAFFDGSVAMTESVAICQYLVTRAPTPLAVAPDEPAYGEYLNALHFGEATLTFPQTLVLRYARFEPQERRSPQVAADYAKWFHARLRVLEPRLAAREYLCADRFTAADISVGFALLLAERIGLDEAFLPATRAYWGRLKRREAFGRALAAQDTAAVRQNVSLQSPLVDPA